MVFWQLLFLLALTTTLATRVLLPRWRAARHRQLAHEHDARRRAWIEALATRGLVAEDDGGALFVSWPPSGDALTGRLRVDVRAGLWVMQWALPAPLDQEEVFAMQLLRGDEDVQLLPQNIMPRTQPTLRVGWLSLPFDMRAFHSGALLDAIGASAVSLALCPDPDVHDARLLRTAGTTRTPAETLAALDRLARTLHDDLRAWAEHPAALVARLMDAPGVGARTGGELLDAVRRGAPDPEPLLDDLARPLLDALDHGVRAGTHHAYHTRHRVLRAQLTAWCLHDLARATAWFTAARLDAVLGMYADDEQPAQVVLAWIWAAMGVEALLARGLLPPPIKQALYAWIAHNQGLPQHTHTVTAALEGVLARRPEDWRAHLRGITASLQGRNALEAQPAALARDVVLWTLAQLSAAPGLEARDVDAIVALKHLDVGRAVEPLTRMRGDAPQVVRRAIDDAVAHIQTRRIGREDVGALSVAGEGDGGALTMVAHPSGGLTLEEGS